MTITFTIERSGRVFKTRANGDTPFFVGMATHYTDKSTGEDFQGLFNVPASLLPKMIYSSDDYRDDLGFWADFIAPTAKCEGGNYLTLNTYDRAKFTFGFGQFGAHVADGDFVLFFRDLLGRSEAADYFPDLHIGNGRITKLSPAGEKPLETATSTQPLMDYLNPTTTNIEDDEVIAGAKLIHWTSNNRDARALQVKHMISAFTRLMASADRNLKLDGRTSDLCLIVCDILHQGRAKYAAIHHALVAGNPRSELLKLGSIAYPDRIKTLRAAVTGMEALLMSKHWNHAQQDFV